MRHAGAGNVYSYESHHNHEQQLVNEQQKHNNFQAYGHGHAHPHGLQQPLQHSLAAATHLLPPPPTHGNVYERSVSQPVGVGVGVGVGVNVGYPMLGDDTKSVLPPINDYMHHMQQQQPDLIYYPVKND